MDYKLKYTLEYAQQELKEIQELSDTGKLTDKGAFVRMFQLGKVLTGWDDEVSEAEQVNNLIEANRMVMELVDNVSKVNAS